MEIYDRLYGKLEFPSIIESLLDCPGVLRLREIGMSNIPVHFSPGFSSISRYEHTLGVCYLADQFSGIHGLSNKERLELMIAALYHDVGTPPFAHLFEDILKSKFQFDHEEHIYNVLSNKSNDIGKRHIQIYETMTLKLNKVCQSREAEKIGIDLNNIIDLIAGKSNLSYGRLINSNSVDLDNIDNIVRGASCLCPSDKWFSLPMKILHSYSIIDGKYSLECAPQNYIDPWIKARETIYEIIYDSIIDCAIEVMYKDTIKILFLNNRLNEADWKMTESQLANVIKEDECAGKIYTKIKLLKPYQCLFLFDLLCHSQSEPENIAKDIKILIETYFLSLKRISNNSQHLEFGRIKIEESDDLIASVTNETRRIIYSIKKNRCKRHVKNKPDANGLPYILGFFSSVEVSIKADEKKVLLSQIMETFPQVIRIRHKF